ncbi:AMP-binding protein [Streptomyces sp. S1D4-20]|uniref:AMP-binding protein n=1 Tax=Streptomyces sp. S1D4-20 TaxID=2594462 RepID=UPI00116569BB|nr:AMP-binding protein [Streptomyces sp. S1D4-20]QDN54249.1 acyl--CoA ligase [Streptomyces sp. S1D4-20]
MSIDERPPAGGTTAPENLARVWHRLAISQPELPALVADDHTISWALFKRAAAGVAATLRQAAIGTGDTVVITLGNRPEHLIALAGCLRAGAAPVCADPWDILRGPLHRLAPAAVIFDAAYTEQLNPERTAHDSIRVWLCADREAPSWALPWPDPLTSNNLSTVNDRRPAGNVLFRLSQGLTDGGTVYRWSVQEFTRRIATRPPGGGPT